MKIIVIFIALISPLFSADRSYAPGAYGKVKDAPMFICWREWDGEIRLGGVAKMFSTRFYLGSDEEAEAYFAVEIKGGSGSANHEQLLFGDGTSEIAINANYKGVVTCKREPKVQKLPDGSWSITFVETPEK